MVVCHCRSDHASWNRAINPNNQWGKFLMFRDFRIFFFVKTLKTWLPVFSSTGEKLSSCHAILTSRKMNRLKHAMTLSGSPRGRRGAKSCPTMERETGGDRELWLQERRWAEASTENNAGVKMPKLLLTNCWRFSMEESESWKLRGHLVIKGPPQFCEIHFREHNIVFIIDNRGEKNSWSF